jgi:hypothetical protein
MGTGRTMNHAAQCALLIAPYSLNNNDLRHAEISDTIPNLSRVDVDRLFAIARNLVAAQLRLSGLPVP